MGHLTLTTSTWSTYSDLNYTIKGLEVLEYREDLGKILLNILKFLFTQKNPGFAEKNDFKEKSNESQ